MKVVIASDSFKGSVSSNDAANYLEKGIRRVKPDAVIIKLPLADGGEGTVEAIVTALKGKYIKKVVTGPLGKKVYARFGLIGNDAAVIEMAEASGLALLKEEERNPFKTTTYGTGELIRAALDYGVKDILIGIGGSATNDAGAGMAQALGVSFKDIYGNEIGFGAESLKDIHTIDVLKLDQRIKDTKITVLSDVTNPLCGKNGASYIYGPQKGASSSDIVKLDQILYEFGTRLEEELNINILHEKGAGAAGGLGAGLIAFCGAKLYSGTDMILEMIKLEEYIRDADLVITGEGMMDHQSVNGKAPLGVAKVAKKFSIPVIAIVGSEGENLEEVYNNGIDLVIDIINKPMNISEAMQNAGKLIERAGEKAVRAFYLNKQ